MLKHPALFQSNGLLNVFLVFEIAKVQSAASLEIREYILYNFSEELHLELIPLGIREYLINPATERAIEGTIMRNCDTRYCYQSYWTSRWTGRFWRQCSLLCLLAMEKVHTDTRTRLTHHQVKILNSTTRSVETAPNSDGKYDCFLRWEVKQVPENRHETTDIACIPVFKVIWVESFMRCPTFHFTLKFSHCLSNQMCKRIVK